MFLPAKERMQCSTGIGKDEGGSPGQDEDKEVGTDQSPVHVLIQN